jgi:hypothetical protein
LKLTIWGVRASCGGSVCCAILPHFKRRTKYWLGPLHSGTARTRLPGFFTITESQRLDSNPQEADTGCIGFSRQAKVHGTRGIGQVLQELERHLTNRVEAYTSDEPDALVQALIELVQPSQFRAIISAIVNDEQLLQQAINRSSIHNNGFLKLILVSNPNYQLRLHVWDTRESEFAVQESVHSHTADFASVIVHGGYRHEVFRESTTGENYFSYRYHASRGARSFTLTSTGPKHLQRVSDAYLQEHTVYTLAGDILHRVVPRPTCLTASLVLQGPPAYSRVLVYAEEPLTSGTSLSVRPLPAEAFAGYANELLSDPGFLQRFT